MHVNIAFVSYFLACTQARISLHVQLRGGEQKCTKKNRTPIRHDRTVRTVDNIEAILSMSVHNGFSRPSGKRLQLHSWDRSVKPLANQAPAAASILDVDFANLMVLLIPSEARQFDWRFFAVVVVTCSNHFSWYSLSNTQQTLTFAIKLLTGRLGSDHYHSKLASA